MVSPKGHKGGHLGSLAYATSKNKILTFPLALAKELDSQGIPVNTVASGLILCTSFHNNHITKEFAYDIITDIPIQRAGNAVEVVRAVLYLA